MCGEHTRQSMKLRLERGAFHSRDIARGWASGRLERTDDGAMRCTLVPNAGRNGPAGGLSVGSEDFCAAWDLPAMPT